MPKRPSKRFATVILLCLAMAGMVALVSYSPTLYRKFCAATGVNGAVRRAEAPKQNKAADRTITVSFDSNVAPGLDWDFTPAQKSVTVHVGEPVKVYYDAHNRGDRAVVGRALYNVTPYKVAPYFFKIQCFCFTNERLGPGESARMPLVFYVDEEFLKDNDMRDVTDITLSYTFFAQKDLDQKGIDAARALKAGSEALDASLNDKAKPAFKNDAPFKQ